MSFLVVFCVNFLIYIKRLEVWGWCLGFKTQCLSWNHMASMRLELPHPDSSLPRLGTNPLNCHAPLPLKHVLISTHPTSSLFLCHFLNNNISQPSPVPEEPFINNFYWLLAACKYMTFSLSVTAWWKYTMRKVFESKVCMWNSPKANISMEAAFGDLIGNNWRASNVHLAIKVLAIYICYYRGSL